MIHDSYVTFNGFLSIKEIEIGFHLKQECLILISKGVIRLLAVDGDDSKFIHQQVNGKSVLLDNIHNTEVLLSHLLNQRILRNHLPNVSTVGNKSEVANTQKQNSAIRD